MKIMNPICFYHKADLDGVCSAAIVKHFVTDCELYGIDYGDEFPWDRIPFVGNPAQGPGWHTIEGPRTVYMVDFSLKPEGMKRLAEVSKLVWIDHHKTCEPIWEELGVSGSFSTLKAACELTWGYFSKLHDAGETPEAVRLLGRYDVRDKDNPEWESRILPFQYGMRGWLWAYLPDDSRWQHVLNGLPEDPDMKCWWSFDRTMNDGNAILQHQDPRIAEAEAGALADCYTK